VKTLWLILFTALIIVLPVVGIIEGFNVYADMTKSSDYYGILKHYDPYEDFNIYDNDLTDIGFSQTDTGYMFTKDYSTHIDFDGTNNSYNVLINNKPCDITISNGGNLYAQMPLNFYDLNNGLIAAFHLEVYLEFYISKTTLTITADCTTSQYGLLLQYIEQNGFKIRIIDGQYNSGIIDNSGPAWHTLGFVSSSPSYGYGGLYTSFSSGLAASSGEFQPDRDILGYTPNVTTRIVYDIYYERVVGGIGQGMILSSQNLIFEGITLYNAAINCAIGSLTYGIKVTSVYGITLSFNNIDKGMQTNTRVYIVCKMIEQFY